MGSRLRSNGWEGDDCCDAVTIPLPALQTEAAASSWLPAPTCLLQEALPLNTIRCQCCLYTTIKISALMLETSSRHHQVHRVIMGFLEAMNMTSRMRVPSSSRLFANIEIKIAATHRYSLYEPKRYYSVRRQTKAIHFKIRVGLDHVFVYLG